MSSHPSPGSIIGALLDRSAPVFLLSLTFVAAIGNLILILP